ncbi:MAG: acyltransferase [Isosphaeraceae bacterium]|nr:acyltransferase [Isosphaeraceae bacterium]
MIAEPTPGIASEAAPPSPPRVHPPRYRSLDVWRGIAALMIVVHHAGFIVDVRDLAPEHGDLPARTILLWIFKAMDLGVPLFFVISGYCIAASADRSRSAPLRFLARRFHRIYPTYWAALAVFIVIIAGLDLLGLERLHHGARALELSSPGDLSAAQWFGNITLTETWRFHVFGDHEKIFTRIAWSLCYEEQFYFVCFLVLWIVPRRFISAMVVATLALLVLRVAAWDTGWLFRFRGTFPVLWHEFALGLAVYHRLVVAESPWARRLGEFFIVAILAAAIGSGYRETAVAAIFALLLVILRPFDDAIADSPWTRTLRECGIRSYSIYLVHLPICVVCSLLLWEWGFENFWARGLIAAPMVATASVGFSWIFFEIVERRLSRRRSSSSS